MIEVEVVFVIYEVKDRTVLLELEQACIKGSPTHSDELPSEELHLVLILDLNLLIKRKDDSSVNIVLVKFYGECTDNVSETSDLNKRTYLR